jgi:hypothetical protein
LVSGWGKAKTSWQKDMAEENCLPHVKQEGKGRRGAKQAKEKVMPFISAPPVTYLLQTTPTS